METYLVGGAVRDALLGLPVTDRDWVVVGATPDALISQGFVSVGRDFPVFLHPVTREEYALARTERKSGPGYRGFTLHASPDVSLQEDLGRRDLTINSIAVEEAATRAGGLFSLQESSLIDPWGGLRDLRRGVLRHVTPAFSEDPVRILRVARFAARLPDFSVAPDTLALMGDMVQAGETRHLVPERVWQEISRGLMAARPSRMLQVLQECGVLAQWLAEITPSPALMATLDRCAAQAVELPVRFACLCAHTTPQALQDLCQRLRVPLECRELAELLQRERQAMDSLDPQDGAGLLGLLERCDSFRRPARLALLRQAFELLHDLPGGPVPRLGMALTQALQAAQALNTQAVASTAAAQGLRGPAVGERVRRARLEAISLAIAAML